MKKRHKQPSLADGFGGEEMLIFWAFRYFLPRQSIITYAFATNLAAYVRRLPKNIQKTMTDDIQSGLRNGCIPERMHAAWLEVLDAIRGEKQKEEAA